MPNLTLQMLGRTRHHVVLMQSARGGTGVSASGVCRHRNEGEGGDERRSGDQKLAQHDLVPGSCLACYPASPNMLSLTVTA